MKKNTSLNNNAETQNNNHFNEAAELENRGNFSRREVGLTHPDTSSFIKLNDKGEIEIFAGEQIGIIISPVTGTISLFADVVKIHSKEDNGFRWNNMSFNYAGDTYNEPALVKLNEKEINSGFNYANHYLSDLDELDKLDNSSNSIVTINGDYGFRQNSAKDETTIVRTPVSSIGQEDMNLLKEYALTNSQEKINYMKQLLEAGYTFSQAREKTMRDKGA